MVVVVIVVVVMRMAVYREEKRRGAGASGVYMSLKVEDNELGWTRLLSIGPGGRDQKLLAPSPLLKYSTAGVIKNHCNPSTTLYSCAVGAVRGRWYSRNYVSSPSRVWPARPLYTKFRLPRYSYSLATTPRFDRPAPDCRRSAPHNTDGSLVGISRESVGSETRYR